MPCNCDYMEPSHLERELSRVQCLLDELDGRARKIDRAYWDGFHPEVYGRNVDGDALVEKLCSRLQNTDVKRYSLEMQIWWRDHQAADKSRLASEVARKKTTKAKAAALAKLTDYERKLLGLS